MVTTVKVNLAVGEFTETQKRCVVSTMKSAMVLHNENNWSIEDLNKHVSETILIKLGLLYKVECRELFDINKDNNYMFVNLSSVNKLYDKITVEFI